MPIVQTSLKSKNYNALGIDEIADDIENIIAVVNDIPTPSYKVYTALLTQTGTNAPVATILENTLAGTITWTRPSDGKYYGTLTGAFLENKTFFLLTSNSFERRIYFDSNYGLDFNVNQVALVSLNLSNTLADIQQPLRIEIRVYN